MISKLISANDIDFIKSHKSFYTLSFCLVIISILFLSFRGLNLGIDFSGGIMIEFRMKDRPDISKVRDVLNLKEVGKVDIQYADEQDVIVRVAKGDDQEKTISLIKGKLNNIFTEVEYRKVDFVGPKIGSELIKKGVIATIISFLSIMTYIGFRFNWQFGVGAILAIVHDVILTFGFFAITRLEFNLTSIAALLTVIGYSINDSVVIYDRIRENLRKFKKMDLFKIINKSLNSSLRRTIITSFLTLISLLALVIFGGKVLLSFSLAVFFGVVIGTFSSIYIASPILIYIDPRDNNDNDKAKLA